MEKTTLKTENRSTVLHNLFFLDMYRFTVSIIKNNPVKNLTPLFLIMEGFRCLANRSWYWKTELFTSKFSLSCNSKFDILPNFNLVLSKNLVKVVQEFDRLDHKYFKL